MATLRFHIVPNGKQNQMMGEHGAAINIKLRKLHRLAGWLTRSKGEAEKCLLRPFELAMVFFVCVSVRSDVLAKGELCFT
jgi:hypothetical protein